MNIFQTALAPTRVRSGTSQINRGMRWSQEEDELLTSLVDGKNDTINWSSYVSHFQGRTPQQLMERWTKVLNPNLVKGSWTRDEDEKIIHYVMTNGTKSWTKLATILPGRIGKQCRERWQNHLDPNLNKGPWTPEEDKLLIELHEKYGNKWSVLATLIPHRSDNNIKNHWNSTLRKQMSEHSSPILPNKNTPVLPLETYAKLQQYEPASDGVLHETH